MTTSYHDRITAIREAVALQITVLAEVSADLRLDGNTDLAAEVNEIVELLESDGENGSDPDAEVERVDKAILGLKELGNRLHKLGFKHAVLALDGARAVLKDRRNRLIADTQPIDPKDIEMISKDRKE